MQRSTQTLSLILLLTLFSANILAGSNARRGNAYYNHVCGACHKQADVMGGPNTRTMDEWVGYLAADQHAAKGSANPSVRYYLSQAYREEIKASNLAAKKFIKIEEDQLFQDIRAYLITKAKDSDEPGSCF